MPPEYASVSYTSVELETNARGLMLYNFEGKISLSLFSQVPLWDSLEFSLFRLRKVMFVLYNRESILISKRIVVAFSPSADDLEKKSIRVPLAWCRFFQRKLPGGGAGSHKATECSRSLRENHTGLHYIG